MPDEKIAEAFIKITADHADLKKKLGESKHLLGDFVGEAKKSLLAFGGVLAAGFTLEKIIEAFAHAEVATNQLKAALTSIGAPVTSTMHKLEEYNDTLLANTTIGHSAAMEAEKFAITLGVPVQHLEAITTAAIGLSRVYSIDLQSATKMVTEAGEGYFTKLQRMIPALKNAKNAEQARAIVSEQVRKGLVLEAEYMDTLSGMWAQFENHLHGVAVALGTMLAPALKVGTELLDQLAIHMKDILVKVGAASYDIPNLSKMLNGLFSTLKGSGGIWDWFGKAVVSVAQTMVSAFDSMVGAVETLGESLAALKGLMEGIRDVKAGNTGFQQWIARVVANGMVGDPKNIEATRKALLEDQARQKDDSKKAVVDWKKLIEELRGKIKPLPFAGVPGLPGGNAKEKKESMYEVGKIFHGTGSDALATGGDIKKLGDRIISKKDVVKVEAARMPIVALRPGQVAPKPLKRVPRPKRPPRVKKPMVTKTISVLDAQIRERGAAMKLNALKQAQAERKLRDASNALDAWKAVKEGRAEAGPGLYTRMGKDGAGERHLQTIAENTRKQLDYMRQQRQGGLADTPY